MGKDGVGDLRLDGFACRMPTEREYWAQQRSWACRMWMGEILRLERRGGYFEHPLGRKFIDRDTVGLAEVCRSKLSVAMEKLEEK